MSLAKTLLMRAFGRPEGWLGWLGGLIMARGNKAMAARVVDLLDVQPGARVIEIGFGPGVGIAQLAAATRADSIAGVDPSAPMIAQAQRRNAQAIRDGRVDLRPGTAAHLPFDDESFDGAMAINSMQLWADAAAGLREIARVLKPEGTLVLGFTPASGQPEPGARQAVDQAGYIGTQILHSDHGFCIRAKKPSSGG